MGVVSGRSILGVGGQEKRKDDFKCSYKMRILLHLQSQQFSKFSSTFFDNFLGHISQNWGFVWICHRIRIFSNRCFDVDENVKYLESSRNCYVLFQCFHFHINIFKPDPQTKFREISYRSVILRHFLLFFAKI